MKHATHYICCYLCCLVFSGWGQEIQLHSSRKLSGLSDCGFVPGRPYFYAVGGDIRIFDYFSALEVVRINETGAFTFASDGRHAAIHAKRGVSLYDFQTNKLKAFLRDTAIQSIAWHENTLLVYGSNRVTKWDLNGKQLQSWNFNLGSNESLYLLPSGVHCLIYTTHKESWRLVNFATNVSEKIPIENFVYDASSQFLAYYANGKVNVRDLHTQRIILEYPMSSQLSISIGEGSRFVARSREGIQCVEIATGKLIEQFTSEFFDYSNSRVRTGKNGREFVGLDNQHGLWLKDNTRYGFIGTFEVPASIDVSFSPQDEAIIIYAGGLNKPLQWDLERNALRILATDTVKRWDYSTGELVYTRVMQYGKDMFTDFTRSETYAGNAKVIIKPEPKGLMNFAITVKTPAEKKIGINCYAVSDDGKLLFTGGERVDCIELASGRKIRTFKSVYLPTSIYASPKGSYAISENKLLDVVSGTETEISDFYYDRYSFDPWEKGLFHCKGGLIDYRDLKSLNVLKRFKGHTGNVQKVMFFRDSLILSFADDGEIKIWNFNTQREVATLMRVDQQDWLVTTPEGLFDASPQLLSETLQIPKLYFVVSDSADIHEPYKDINVNQLKQRYYQPGLISILLGFRDESLRQVPRIGKFEFAPKINLLLEDDKLKIDVQDAGGGIGKVSLMLAGAELIENVIPEAQRASVNKQFSTTIDLRQFKNRLSYEENNILKVVAWNKGEWIVSDPMYVAYKAIAAQAKGAEAEVEEAVKQPVSIYALVAGTSDYSGERIDLRYAAKDATDFYNAFRLASAELVGSDRVHTTLLTTDEKGPRWPSRDNIITSLKSYSASQPQDVVLLYLSGHGVNFGGQDGDFYYLTSLASGADANYLKDQHARENFTISSKELTKLLNDIPARKKILILDACNSGKAAEVMVTTRDVPASQVRSLDRLSERTGFYVLAGSAADAVSYETSMYGQGLLTYALLKAIRGSALRIDGNEEYVDVQKLLQYAVDQVPQMARGIGGIQQPLFRSPSDQRSYDIGKVTPEIKQKIDLSEPKPVFVASVFQDEEEMLDKIGLAEMLNGQLRDISSRGRQATVVFTEAKDYPDAYKISGRYRSVNGEISATFIVSKNNSKVAGPINVQGTPSTLLVKIIDAVNTSVLLKK